MKRRILRFVGIASTVILGLSTAGVAVATPGSGASGAVLGKGTAMEKVKTRGNQPYDVVVQSITIARGGHTGWHTHPGIAVAVVKQGALIVYDGDDASCTPQRYAAGDVYVDPGYGHVHIAYADPDTDTEVLVTYLDVPIGGVIRIDQDDPGNCD
jgi:quercetin dioxygenase-like cupin family protein